MLNLKKEKSITVLSFLGKFIDKDLENEYILNEINNIKIYVRPLALILGILYLLFLVPDYYLIKNPDTFKIILLDRLVFLALTISLSIVIKYIKSPAWFYRCITLYEIMASLLFIFTFHQYESPNFLIQSFGVMLIILGLFLVPNKWIYTIFVCVLLSTLFFSICINILKPIKTSELYAGVVYTWLVIIFMGVSSLRINKYKRIQYISNKELLKLSTLDPLTGIYNRLKFDEELDKFISLSKRYNNELSIILFDIDNFKKINDDFGHLTGDMVLVDTAKMVRDSIRDTDIFARWGGEEFVILLPNTNKIKGLELAERLHRMISKHPFPRIGQVTCSFGVTSLSREDNGDSLVNRADNLLYKAKDRGKNQIAG